MSTEDDLVESLKEHYGAAARKAARGAPVIEQGCGPAGGATCGSGDGDAAEAFGVDMTDDMLELARANQARAGVTNAEFLRGRIEEVPLPDRSVDVVVSHCVINLSPDKDAVFTEAHRVLRPGGRLAVADVVADHDPEPGRPVDDAAWAACTAGAVTRDSYRSQLEGAGFRDVEIVDSHAVAEGFWSVFVRAAKPT